MTCDGIRLFVEWLVGWLVGDRVPILLCVLCLLSCRDRHTVMPTVLLTMERCVIITVTCHVCVCGIRVRASVCVCGRACVCVLFCVLARVGV